MGQKNFAINADGEEITLDYVEERVDDWLARIETLFQSIRQWAKSNKWVITDETPTPMTEDLVSRFGATNKNHPNISLRSPEGKKVWIKPKGLWVIGANGRIDVFSAKGAFVIIDVAQKFQKPHWMLYGVGKTDGKSTDGKSFEPAHLGELA